MYCGSLVFDSANRTVPFFCLSLGWFLRGHASPRKTEKEKRNSGTPSPVVTGTHVTHFLPRSVATMVRFLSSDIVLLYLHDVVDAYNCI